MKQYKARTDSHRDRLQWFTTYPELRAYRKEYDWLSRQAHAARYYLPDWYWTYFDTVKKRAEPMIRALLSM